MLRIKAVLHPRTRVPEQNMRIMPRHRKPLMPVQENQRGMPVIIPTPKEKTNPVIAPIHVMGKPSSAREARHLPDKLILVSLHFHFPFGSIKTERGAYV